MLIDIVKMRVLLSCLLVLVFRPMVIVADDNKPPNVGNGDTIVLTAQEIRAMQALKIADVLNHVPGVKAGDASVSIHGSYKVKVFVDGRPINDPTSSHGGIRWDMVSPDEVERIEILRGKGGMAYGQDAAGGVVLITTRRERRWSGNVKCYAGNFETFHARGTANAAVGPVAGGVSWGYETTGGYDVNNDKEIRRVGLKLDHAREESGRRMGFSADLVRDERGLNGLPQRPTPFARKESRNTALALHAQLSRIKTQTTYNEGSTHNTDTSTGLDRTLRVSKLGQDLSTVLQTTKWGDLSCGASFSWDRADGNSFEDQQEQGLSVYAAQNLALPGGGATLTFGVRANYHSDFDSTLNPEIKVVYRKPSWRLTGSYSRTENIPSFHQRYNETSSTRPNPDLSMERADNFSLAFFATPHPDFSFSLTGFYNLLSDRITYVTGDDGIGQYQNFGSVLYAGGDAAVNAKLTDSLKLKAAYTYLQAKDRDTGLWIPAKARHTAHATLFWQPCAPLSVVITGTYSSKVYRNKANTRHVPAYAIAEVRAEYGFQRWSVFVEITNLLDKTYYYADGLLAPPLIWVAGVNWRF
jgi:iron complex outermembrane receptor protein